VYVRGFAKGSKIVEVTIICQAGEVHAVAEVDPVTGRWLVRFDGWEAECICEGPITVKAWSAEPPNPDCIDVWELDRLPCEEPPPPEECDIEITDVYGVRSPTGELTVYVHGIAKGTKIVEVIIVCQAGEVRAKAEVDPVTGEWFVRFNGREAECICEGPITVRVWSVDPPNPDCVDVWVLERLPCEEPPPPEECDIEIEDVYGEIITTDSGETVINLHVSGVAKGIREVSIEVECEEKTGIVRALGVVNPSTGRWEVTIEGLKAEQCIICEEPIIVKASSADPANPDCVDVWELDQLPCEEGVPPESTEPIRTIETTSLPPGFVPGFGFIEVLFAFLALLGLASLRARK